MNEVNRKRRGRKREGKEERGTKGEEGQGRVGLGWLEREGKEIRTLSISVVE